MGTIIRNISQGWRALSAIGNIRNERAFPRTEQFRSVDDVHRVIATELWDDPSRHAEVPMAILSKDWDPDSQQWIDDFTYRLRFFRQKAGVSQAQLAQTAGLSIQSVSALEQGTRQPTLDTVRRLAVALGVEVEDFGQVDSGQKRDPLPPQFSDGDSVKYGGRITRSDAEGNVLLKPGMVGSVVESSQGWTTRAGEVNDGYNRVRFSNGYSLLVKAEDHRFIKVERIAP